MLLAFPDDHRCNADQWPYQYMFGESILVAPVYGDFQTMEIYLPESTAWTDYWTGNRYPEGGLLRVDVRDIETLPLFIREGAILVMREESNWIDPTRIDDPLCVEVYPSAQSDFTLYEDDGVSLRYQDEEVSKTRFSCKREGETIIFRVSASDGRFEGFPSERSIHMRFHGLRDEPETVSVDGRPAKKRKQGRQSVSSVDTWSFDPVQGVLTVRIMQETKRESILHIH
jgi:alpha-glucosidase (family GH31 glycosyl hydrolase)